METNETMLEQFRKFQAEIADLNSANAILNWDMETAMPKRGSDGRARIEATLAGIIHEKTTKGGYPLTLEYLKGQVDGGLLAGEEARSILKSWKLFDRQRKLTATFVSELAEATSAAHHVWVEARKASDFAIFRPSLERIITMMREKAEMLGYNGSPYDALFEEFEPDATAANVRPVLEQLRAALVPIVKSIAASGIKPQRLKIPMALGDQQKFCRWIAGEMGLDFEATALATVAHPMCNRMHPGDTRISTRYDESDLLYGLGSVIHEAGHALYEQGLPADHWGSPLGDAISMAVHESQSRLWENIIGRSQPFCDWLAPKLGCAYEDLLATLNVVEPSLIRTEADEVTYNLHICLRFELELDLIERRLEVKDLPEAWNAKMKEYLGIEVPNDAKGVLQDVHWSAGLIGYFPTYALGNLMSAQFAHQAAVEIPDMADSIARGDFKPLGEWLRTRIHQKGSTRTADELLREVTGSKLDASYFTNYLTSKFGEIYRL